MSRRDSISTPSVRKSTRLIDLSGRKIWRWTVVGIACRKGRVVYWDCICECGTRKAVSGSSLKYDGTQSCGCLRHDTPPNKTHGLSKFRIRGVWNGMIRRCHVRGSQSYHLYGARGISVCERWRTSLENFRKDMGDPPDGPFSIDRIDNDGNYEPANCRWTTSDVQNRNKRDTRLVSMNGKTLCLKDWCSELGMNYFTVIVRIKNGATDIEALTRPLFTRTKKGAAGGKSE